MGPRVDRQVLMGRSGRRACRRGTGRSICFRRFNTAVVTILPGRGGRWWRDIVLRCVGRSGRSGRIGRARTVICGARCRGFRRRRDRRLEQRGFRFNRSRRRNGGRQRQIGCCGRRGCNALRWRLLQGCGGRLARCRLNRDLCIRGRIRAGRGDNCRYARRCRYRDAGCCRCCHSGHCV